MSISQAITPDFAASDVVIYDGECKFCTKSVMFLRRLDTAGRLRFLSLHDPGVRVDFPDLTYEMLMEQMWVVTIDGRRLPGADAFKYLTCRLPILYPIAPLMHIPFSMPLWRWLYRLIARNRYRIAGKGCSEGTCHLHKH